MLSSTRLATDPPPEPTDLFSRSAFRFEFGEPLIPLTQAWPQVVVGPVGRGGGDGGAAGLVAGVRGAVPRRRGLRPLAVREALARRVPPPRLRARQGPGAGPRHAAGRVRQLPPPGLGDRRDRAAPQPPAAQALVPGGVAGTHRNGMSARQLWEQLVGLGSYKSAWLLLRKLRHAMV